MKISRRAWNEYIDKLYKCNKGAADAMWHYMKAHGIEDVGALINYGYAVATKYGEASAAIAAEMYDATAALAGASVPAAVPAETATYGEVTAAVKKSAEYGNTKTISSAVSRLVKQAGADTTIQNAARDNAQWAWIPSGDTCAFCIALASRGWQYASKRVMKGDHAQHIHANCDCTFAVRFDEKSSYDSYNPDKYAEIYYSAEGSSSTDKINSIRRELYKTNGDTIREQKRIAYAEKKARESGTVVAKSVKDGIMGSDGLTHRKTGENGREIINKAVYNKLTNPILEKDGVIITASEENGWLKRMEDVGATALTIDDAIILRKDATTTEVLEEVYHFQQNRAGHNNQYSREQRFLMNEIEAQEYLISVADKYKIPQAERDETIKLLESYQKQKEKLQKDGGWID